MSTNKNIFKKKKKTMYKDTESAKPKNWSKKKHIKNLRTHLKRLIKKG